MAGNINLRISTLQGGKDQVKSVLRSCRPPESNFDLSLRHLASAKAEQRAMSRMCPWISCDKERSTAAQEDEIFE